MWIITWCVVYNNKYHCYHHSHVMLALKSSGKDNFLSSCYISTDVLEILTDCYPGTKPAGLNRNQACLGCFKYSEHSSGAGVCVGGRGGIA